MGQVAWALPEMGTARGGLLVLGVLGWDGSCPGGVCPSASFCREPDSQLFSGEVNPTLRIDTKECVCSYTLLSCVRVPVLLNQMVSHLPSTYQMLRTGNRLALPSSKRQQITALRKPCITSVLVN